MASHNGPQTIYLICGRFRSISPAPRGSNPRCRRAWLSEEFFCHAWPEVSDKSARSMAGHRLPVRNLLMPMATARARQAEQQQHSAGAKTWPRDGHHGGDGQAWALGGHADVRRSRGEEALACARPNRPVFAARAHRAKGCPPEVFLAVPDTVLTAEDAHHIWQARGLGRPIGYGPNESIFCALMTLLCSEVPPVADFA